MNTYIYIYIYICSRWCGPEIYNGILPWGNEENTNTDNGRMADPSYKQKLRRGALF